MAFPVDPGQPVRAQLNRAEWRRLSDGMKGEEVPARLVLQVDGATVDFDFDDLRSSGMVAYTPSATDLRIGDLQLLVSRERVVLLRRDGYGRDAVWQVLYDGPLGSSLTHVPSVRVVEIPF